MKLEITTTTTTTTITTTTTATIIITTTSITTIINTSITVVAVLMMQLARVLRSNTPPQVLGSNPASSRVCGICFRQLCVTDVTSAETK